MKTRSEQKTEQRALWVGAIAAVVGFVFLLAMVRPFGETLAPSSCWNGVSDSNLASGLLCEGLSAHVGQCAQWFGVKAINDSSQKDSLKVCVGAGELVRDMNLLVALVLAGLFDWFVGRENLKHAHKTQPPLPVAES